MDRKPFERKNKRQVSQLRDLPFNQSVTILSKAGDGVRTRDSKLGKLALYQLSYTRLFLLFSSKEQILRGQNFVNKILRSYHFFSSNCNSKRSRSNKISRMSEGFPNKRVIMRENGCSGVCSKISTWRKCSGFTLGCSIAEEKA